MNARIIAAAASLAVLAGCGFHLREAPQLPPQMRTLYIASGGHNAELIRDLRRGLESETTTVIDDPTQAAATLSIISVSHNSRALVLNRRGQPLEYQVAYSAEYTLIAGGVVYIAPEAQTLTRNYNYSVSNAIADQEQEDVLYSALTNEMAQLIIFRIEAVARSLPPVVSTAPKAASAAPAQTAHDISPAPATAVPPAATRPRPPVVE
jgi:LPS-assembly lipoprotein